MTRSVKALDYELQSVAALPHGMVLQVPIHHLGQALQLCIFADTNGTLHTVGDVGPARGGKIAGGEDVGQGEGGGGGSA